MPFWRIYHPETAFTEASERHGLAEDITELYTSRGLPAFEVQIVYIPIPLSCFFVGGQVQPLHDAHPPRPPFIRIAVQYVSRDLPPSEDEPKDEFLNRVDAALRPHIEDKGYEWEYHIEMTDRTLNKINGMLLPETHSEIEKKWAEEGKPTKFEGAYRGRRIMDNKEKEEEKEEKEGKKKEEKQEKKEEEKGEKSESKTDKEEKAKTFDS